jgi:hypothetical protein
MKAPTTIPELLTTMKHFVDKGWDINASDISHEDKLAKLNALSEELGLA